MFMLTKSSFEEKLVFQLRTSNNVIFSNVNKLHNVTFKVK